MSASHRRTPPRECWSVAGEAAVVRATAHSNWSFRTTHRATFRRLLTHAREVSAGDEWDPGVITGESERESHLKAGRRTRSDARHGLAEYASRARAHAWVAVPSPHVGTIDELRKTNTRDGLQHRCEAVSAPRRRIGTKESGHTGANLKNSGRI